MIPRRLSHAADSDKMALDCFSTSLMRFPVGNTWTGYDKTAVRGIRLSAYPVDITECVTPVLTPPQTKNWSCNWYTVHPVLFQAEEPNKSVICSNRHFFHSVKKAAFLHQITGYVDMVPPTERPTLPQTRCVHTSGLSLNLPVVRWGCPGRKRFSTPFIPAVHNRGVPVQMGSRFPSGFHLETPAGFCFWWMQHEVDRCFTRCYGWWCPHLSITTSVFIWIMQIYHERRPWSSA